MRVHICGVRGSTPGPGPEFTEGFEVVAREIPHKGGRSFGYRISDSRGSLAYLSERG